MGATLERAARELRHAVRRLARTPVFTVATILTLGLTIGANVAIFTVVHRVVLNPLPYGDSGRLVALDHAFPQRNIRAGVNLTAQLYYWYLDRARTLDGIALVRTEERTLTGAGVPERVRVARTTPSLATVLRVGPEQGRWFTEAEGEPGAPAAAVISHGAWIRMFGADVAVLGRRVTIDGLATSIVGIMPASFEFPDARVDLWIPDPLSRATATAAATAGVYDFTGVGRLRPGVSIADTRAELTRLAGELAPTAPGQGYDKLVSTATLLIDATVGSISRTLWILLVSAALVLLVACANVANLYLVRSEAKQREIAVRRALGAGSGGIVSYFLAESLWLAAIGGALGVLLAWFGVRMLVASAPATLPRLHEVRLDAIALAFAGVVSLVAGAAFGSIPLLRMGSVSGGLHESGRGSTVSRARHVTRHVLMGVQVALAVVLLIASGLMLRSFQKLRAVNPGFNAASALTFRIGLPRHGYAERDRMVAAHSSILQHVATLPGVTAASVATCLPLAEQGCLAGPLFVERRVLPPGTNPPFVRVAAVAGGFFEAMGTRILSGRSIDARDVDNAQPVVVINQALATIVFPRQDPIGQRIRLGNPAVSPNPAWLQVVGVAESTSYRALAEATPVPIMYMPMFAARLLHIMPPLDGMSYVLRTAIAPEGLTAAARRAVNEVDQNLAIAQVRTLRETIDRASAPTRFIMILLVTAAGVALVLGVIGIYGVTSYVVSQRTGEIGVRLALGARPLSVASMIVRQGVAVAAAGVLVGLATAAAGSRLIESLLYGVGSRDVGVFAATAALVVIVSVLACSVPARRAARLSPVDALRTE